MNKGQGVTYGYGGYTMDIFSVPVYADSDTSVPVSQVNNVTDSDTSIITGNYENYINTDMFNNLSGSYAQTFSIGFAFATILVLLTYGAFKAFSLVRID